MCRRNLSFPYFFIWLHSCWWSYTANRQSDRQIDMQPRELECFQAVIATGSMTRAAETLRISQPAVSNAIANLERSIGFKLFIRDANRVIPTPEAHIFYKDSERVLDTIRNAKESASRILHGNSGQMTISAFPAISGQFLPRLVARFLADRPHANIKLLSRSSHLVLDLVQREQFDLAVAEVPFGCSGLDSEIFRYECECIVPDDHPLSGCEVITPELLDGVPAASLFREHMTTFQIANAFSRAEAVWNVVFEAHYFMSIESFVASGGGVAIVDPVFSRHADDRVKRIPFRPSIQYQIGIFYPRYQRRSKLTDAFSTVLREALDQRTIPYQKL